MEMHFRQHHLIVMRQLKSFLIENGADMNIARMLQNSVARVQLGWAQFYCEI